MLRADDQEKVYYGGGRRSDSRRSQTLNFTNTNIQYTKYNMQHTIYNIQYTIFSSPANVKNWGSKTLNL